jgi:hypothetical protein
MEKTPSPKPKTPSEAPKGFYCGRRETLRSQPPMTLEAVRRNQATMKPTR